MRQVHDEETGCELYALHEGTNGRLVMIEKYASEDGGGRAPSRARGSPALIAALKGKLERSHGRTDPRSAPGGDAK